MNEDKIGLDYQPDWKEEYQKAVDLHCITLDELREANVEIKRLIDVVGGMALVQPRLDQGPDYERGFVDGMQKQMQSSVDKAVNAMAQPQQKPVLVKEMQRMGKELQESFKLGYDAGVLETQLDQALERNFCPRCGKRLMSALGPVSLHTCCPPSQYSDIVSDGGRDPRNKFDGRTFDDYGNKIV